MFLTPRRSIIQSTPPNEWFPSTPRIPWLRYIPDPSQHAISPTRVQASNILTITYIGHKRGVREGTGLGHYRSLAGYRSLPQDRWQARGQRFGGGYTGVFTEGTFAREPCQHNEAPMACRREASRHATALSYRHRPGNKDEHMSSAWLRNGDSLSGG